MESWLQFHKRGWVVSLKVQAGAKQTTLLGIHGDWIKMRVQAPPIEGRANEAILKWFSKALHAKSDQLEILQGSQQSQKKILIQGVEPELIRALVLNFIPSESPSTACRSS